MVVREFLSYPGLDERGDHRIESGGTRFEPRPLSDNVRRC
jgi:hypothetical protein